MTSRSDVENFFVDDVTPEVGVAFFVSVDGKTCRLTSSSFSWSYRFLAVLRVGQSNVTNFRFPSRNVHMAEKAKAEYDFAALNSLTLVEHECDLVTRALL